jgi:hypothetical protein
VVAVDVDSDIERETGNDEAHVRRDSKTVCTNDSGFIR